MATSNEDLLMEMQRVGSLMRRCHHAKPHGHGHGHGHGMSPKGAPKCPHAKGNATLPAGHPPVGHGAALPPGHPPVGHLHGAGMGKCKHKGSGKHGQARILAALELKDGVSQKDLAFLLGIRPQSLTLALDKLEGDGYIERKQDEADKRARRVYITEAGKQRAAEQAEERASHAEKAFSALTEEEKDQLAAILAKLSAALEEQRKLEEQRTQEDTQEGEED